MRSYLGAEVGLIMAVSWEDEEWTDAFLFFGGWVGGSVFCFGGYFWFLEEAERKITLWEPLRCNCFAHGYLEVLCAGDEVAVVGPHCV